MRGTVPDQLDADLVERIGAAFAAFVAERSRDRRARCWWPGHAPVGRRAVGRLRPGVTSQGLDVVDLGLASTDLLSTSPPVASTPPAAMLTASHNPAQYNGIKLCLAGARPIGEDTGLVEIRDLTVAGVAAGGRAGHREPSATCWPTSPPTCTASSTSTSSSR